MEVHLLVDRLVALELLGSDARRHLQRIGVGVVREQELHSGAPLPNRGGHPRHDRDRELEPLGAVDREDPHRVVVGLGQHRLHHARTFGALEVGPREEVAQAGGLRLRERACLVDDEPHPSPQVARTTVGERDLEHPPLADDPVEQLARAEPEAGVVPRREHRASRRRRGGHRAAPRAGRPGGSTGRRTPRGTCRDRRRHTRTRASAARSPKPARRWGRRPSAARGAGRGSHACRRRATTSPRGTGCRPRRARPRGGRVTCAPAAGWRCRRAGRAPTTRSLRGRGARPANLRRGRWRPRSRRRPLRTFAARRRSACPRAVPRRAASWAGRRGVRRAPRPAGRIRAATPPRRR